MSAGWTITVSATGEPVADVEELAGKLTTLTDILETVSCQTAFSPVGERYTVTIALPANGGDAYEADAITWKAITIVADGRDQAGLPAWPFVNVHVRTFEEHDLEAPLPQRSAS